MYLRRCEDCWVEDVSLILTFGMEPKSVNNHGTGDEDSTLEAVDAVVASRTTAKIALLARKAVGSPIYIFGIGSSRRLEAHAALVALRRNPLLQFTQLLGPHRGSGRGRHLKPTA